MYLKQPKYCATANTRDKQVLRNLLRVRLYRRGVTTHHKWGLKWLTHLTRSTRNVTLLKSREKRLEMTT